MIPRFPKKPAPSKPQTSSILSISHDPATGKLNVLFHGGREYEYDNVSAAHYKALRAAPSKGSYLNEHIIPHHTHQRVNALKPVTEK